MKVNEVMTTKFKYVQPNTIMTDVADIFDGATFHHLPVLDNDKCPLGVISRHDYYQLQHHFTRFGWKDPESSNRHFLSTLLAQEVMSKGLITLNVNDSLQLALEIFLENKVHSILITQKNKCVGVLTPFDILKTLQTLAVP